MKKCALDRVGGLLGNVMTWKTGLALRNSVSKEFRESSNVSLWDPMYHVSLTLSFFLAYSFC